MDYSFGIQVNDILATHNITGGSMNKIQCPGPSSTITVGSFNSITNRCEYSTIVGRTVKFYLSVSFIVVAVVVDQ